MARRETPRPAGSEPAASIPPPPSKAQRDRSWEAKQRSGDFVQVAYRRIPRELRDRITATAQNIGVTTDEIARAFLEHAMQAYQDGNLELNAAPRKGRFTLFGED